MKKHIIVGYRLLSHIFPICFPLTYIYIDCFEMYKTHILKDGVQTQTLYSFHYYEEHGFSATIKHLNHWGRVTHICISKLTVTRSDNGLSPGRRQAIIWTNAGILLIWPLGTIFSENLIEILIFSFTKMRLKVSSAKWRPFCLGLNVLIINQLIYHLYIHEYTREIH